MLKFDCPSGIFGPSFKIENESTRKKSHAVYVSPVMRIQIQVIQFVNFVIHYSLLTECRAVRCYPDRMLVDTECTPLFKQQ